MSRINNQRNHARKLLGLTLATAMLTSIFAVTSYSATRSRSAGVAKRNGAATALTQPQTPALKANGKIAFVSNRDGNDEIYVMDDDGSNQTRLTNNPADDLSPAWSPDGARIVFTSNRDGNLEIYAMNADGGNQTRLTNNSVDDFQPDWSPDGTKIVFVSVGEPGSINYDNIFVMNADGSGQRKIVEGYFFTPVWSPDGTKIASVCFGDVLSEDICVMNATGSDLRHLTRAPFGEFNESPAWSPDGAKILFVQIFLCIEEPCTDTLFVMDADGSNRQQLLSPSTIGNPGWSPDGTMITFDNAGSNLKSDVFVANSGGGGVVNLTNHPARDFDAAWGPVPQSPAPCANPIDCASTFVHQQYLDFLNREPDADGLAFWTNEITSCGTDPGCIEAKRINVSAAFFLSIEFQETGYLVYRMYKSSYGNLAGAPVPITLSEFLPDTQEIGHGVIVNQAGWEQVLENNKQAFSAEFVQRSRFTSAYPTSLTPDQFVDQLFVNAGVAPSATDRQAAINEFGSASTTTDTAARARALRRVAENSTLTQQEFNSAFVLMQYFGYLRRNPNDPPEPGLNFAGYNFWLNKLNQFNGNFRNAEMVKAFLVSTEYRQRFGQP